VVRESLGMDVVEVAADRADQLVPLVSAWRRLVLGDDEPACTDEEAARWFAPRPGRSRRALLATGTDGAAIGYARAHLRTDRPSPVFVPELYVAPTARRQGVGRALVRALSATGRDAGAPMLVLRQDDADPGAAAFADAIGTTRGFRGLQNRCHTADLDVALLDSWVQRARERAAGWSLVGWVGRCPDHLFDAFVAVQSAMHDAPVPVVATVGRSGVELREAEAVDAALGVDHWVLAARNDATGELGGFTELLFEPDQPWLGHQGDTAVVPAHRQLGLGRWLKAAMARRVLSERPGVTQLETNTAMDNPPMRAINEAMGFRVAVVWQDHELALL